MSRRARLLLVLALAAVPWPAARAQVRACAVVPHTNPDGIFTEPYTGGCKAGRAQGQGGYTYISPNVIPRGPMRVRGEFAGGMLNGRAHIEFPNGSAFDGEFKDNERDGPGRLLHPDGLWTVGTWKNGKNWDVTGVGSDQGVRYIFRYVGGKQTGLCRADRPQTLCQPDLEKLLGLRRPP